MSIEKVTTGTKKIFKVDPRIILFNPKNPRKTFEDVEEIENFILEHGVDNLTPIRLKETDNGPMIVCGERRTRAAKGLIEKGKEVKYLLASFVKKDISEEEELSLMLTENNGKNLEPLEEAQAYKELQNLGHNFSQIAKLVGKSVPHVINTRSLLNTSKEVQEALREKKIKKSLANTIAQAGISKKVQSELVKKASEGKEGQKEVRKKLEKRPVIKVTYLAGLETKTKEAEIPKSSFDKGRLLGRYELLRELLNEELDTEFVNKFK